MAKFTENSFLCLLTISNITTKLFFKFTSEIMCYTIFTVLGKIKHHIELKKGAELCCI